jgi:hypothetical protein
MQEIVLNDKKLPVTLPTLISSRQVVSNNNMSAPYITRMSTREDIRINFENLNESDKLRTIVEGVEEK